MIIAQIAHRLGRRFAELGAAIADVDAPQPGAAIDQIPTPPVLYPDPGASGNDRRAVLQVIGDRGRRMEQALPVHLFERVISCRHCFGTLFYQGDERRHSHMRVHLLPCYIELGREDRPGLTVSDEEGLAAPTHAARQLNENPDPADTVGLERHASALLRVTARWRISSLGLEHEAPRARQVL